MHLVLCTDPAAFMFLHIQYLNSFLLVLSSLDFAHWNVLQTCSMVQDMTPWKANMFLHARCRLHLIYKYISLLSYPLSQAIGVFQRILACSNSKHHLSYCSTQCSALSHCCASFVLRPALPPNAYRHKAIFCLSKNG